jgi:hypothetical protein
VIFLRWRDIELAHKYSDLIMFSFIFCTALPKHSIASMVIRLTQTRGMRWAMYALMGSLVIVNGGCVVISFAYCRPYYASWDTNVRDARCVSSKVLDWAECAWG